MLNVQQLHINKHFNKALEDNEFISSPFFPSHPHMKIGNEQSDDFNNKFKKLVIEKHKKYYLWINFFCGPAEIFDKYVKDFSLKELVQWRWVGTACKRQVDGCLYRRWGDLEKSIPLAEEIGQQNKKCFSLTKLQILSQAICPESVAKNKGPTTLGDISINPQNVRQLQNDKALEIIWSSTLQDQLTKMTINVPEPDASAHDIRMFLYTCNVLGEIRKLDLNKKDLTVIPPELNLLVGLTTLVLVNNKIKKIENLEQCVQLRDLCLFKNEIEKIENLEQCVQLERLVLVNNKIKKIENLEQCVQLRNLGLSNNEIEKIENLEQCVQLGRLVLSGNKIKKIENLEQCVQLRELWLSDNEIEKIENLEQCVQLKQLGFGDNKIKKIENLEQCVQLQSLWISNNEIEKIENLEQCVQLQFLDLSNNEINKMEIENINEMLRLKSLGVEIII
jgi:Leucine Rich repeats (2 copies)